MLNILSETLFKNVYNTVYLHAWTEQCSAEKYSVK